MVSPSGAASLSVVTAMRPPALVERLAELARAAIKDPAVIETLAKLGFEPIASGPDDYARQLAQERDRWAPVVAASGFSSDD